MNPFLQHKAYSRMYKEGELTLGLHIPLENYQFETPTMEKQVELAQLAENLGFTSLWFRDVLLEDPNFGDPAVGQIYDMMIYLTFLASQTKEIALGTAAAVLPLRHPLRVAKEIATIDQLFPERLLLGVSSGDRRADFGALGVSHPNRGKLFIKAFDYLNEVLYKEFPRIDTSVGSIHNANLVPKPTNRIPTFITGYAQQDMEWFAQHGDGWMYYPRSPHDQEVTIKRWRELVEEYQPGVFKQFSQPMHLDLAEDPNEIPRPIRLGFRIGRNYLIELLNIYKHAGVNHLFFALFDSQRPAEEVIQELGEEVVPHFPGLKV
ncbi:luciferase-type oxidoreductase, BA3436 family [Marininema mesophilum]|uniref:Luciferase-type oxidoreductase, BA3436 family n=1 Tax=Marininema mesophilum TaxID=1048340 RepID=A0A1H2UNI5_9BACL|nr:LLM class oxidoreductase [Marininema mesophilum]SDW57662.1 luciferase-type oxidoreductase, BA3436 family [Marininema mesophilum]